MHDPDLMRELSRRTGLPESAADAVVHALRDMALVGAIDASILGVEQHPSEIVPLPAVPMLPIARPEDPHLVDQLIARARKHPLGLEFLVSGLLGSVAIALGAHAFTVEAARARLRREQQSNEQKETSA